MSSVASPGQVAQWACVAEVTAPKAGNVHPGSPFEDVSWRDFVTSAMLTRPILDDVANRGIGRTVLDCVMATRQAVGTNTNLGLILLLVPLCAAAEDQSLGEGINRVLGTLTEEDAQAVYEAIRLAVPGGLGGVEKADVHQWTSVGLIEAMRLAADHDAVARQYANGFEDVLHTIAPRVVELTRRGRGLDQAIVRVHLEQMVREPDGLIRRKCGDDVADQSSRRAAAVVDANWPDTAEATRLFDDLDHWLRANGHVRNPGTSADMVAAGLFVAMYEGDIMSPFNWAYPLTAPIV